MNSKVIENFSVPECAYEAIKLIVNDVEQKLIENFKPQEVFSAEEVSTLLGMTKPEAEELLKKTYERNVILKHVGEGQEEKVIKYELGSFYGRLGTFCQFENEVWISVELKTRDAIKDWYLQKFIDRTKPIWEANERADKVVPLEEALQFVKDFEGEFFLTKCDCRTIFGNCDNRLETCIGLDGGPNSAYDRGHARKISRDETLDLVKVCDEEGLIHTIEAYALCNCCSDCCFNILAALKCDTIGTFPMTDTIANWHEDACVHCGLCVKRCPMDAFAKEGKEVTFNSEKCVGCGVCVEVCSKKAITIESR